MATLNNSVVTGTTINGTSYTDTINGDSDSEIIYGNGGNDTVNSYDGNDQLFGNSGYDLLVGGNGNDTLSGGMDGSDTLTGGAGNDVFVVDKGQYGATWTITDFDLVSDRLDLRNVGIADMETLNRLVERGDSGNLTLSLMGSDGYKSTAILNGLWIDEFDANQLILSTTLADNTLTLSGYGDLFGGLGNDNLSASATSSYSNRLFGEQGNDTLDGGTGDDLLLGGSGDDRLLGGNDEDTLEGGSGNDIVEGGENSDLLHGGSGSDTFVVQPIINYSTYDSIGDFELAYDKLDVRALGISDIDTIRRLANGDQSETLLVVGASGYEAQTTLLGTALASLGAANVVLSGATTADAKALSGYGDLFGGLGNDTLSASASSSYSNRLFGEQGNDTLDGGAGDDLLVGGSENDRMLGGGDNDTLEGGSGTDTLDGGEDSDSLNGGVDQDVFVVQARSDGNVLDQITDFNLAQDKLDVRALGISDLDTLRRLASGNGQSILTALDNYYSVETRLAGTTIASLTSANVVLSSSTAANVLTLSGYGDLFGGLGGDTLSASTSSSYNNRLFGEQGNDTLDGGAGHDLVVGGADNDSLLGGDGTDTLDGGLGDDLLAGGEGDDLIDGGAGIDMVSYADLTVGVTVNLNRTDFQKIMAADYDVDRILNVENVTGGSADDRLTGNALANKLYGGAGSDVLSGGLGDDWLHGSTGNDSLNGGGGIDTASYAGASGGVTVNLSISTAAQNTVSAGSDWLLYIENLYGSSYGDKLTGSSGANALNGGGGSDVLAGGSGVDTLTGSTGNDRFDFNALTDSGITSTTRDIIIDFTRGQDLIDLSTLDANAATTTNDAFTTLIGSAESFTAAGQLKLSNGVLYANTDADSTAEFSVQLTGITALALTDFVL